MLLNVIEYHWISLFTVLVGLKEKTLFWFWLHKTFNADQGIAIFDSSAAFLDRTKSPTRTQRIIGKVAMIKWAYYYCNNCISMYYYSYIKLFYFIFITPASFFFFFFFSCDKSRLILYNQQNLTNQSWWTFQQHLVCVALSFSLSRAHIYAFCCFCCFSLVHFLLLWNEQQQQREECSGSKSSISDQWLTINHPRGETNGNKWCGIYKKWREYA